MYQGKVLEEFFDNKPINSEDREGDFKRSILKLSEWDKKSKFNRKLKPNYLVVFISSLVFLSSIRFFSYAFAPFSSGAILIAILSFISLVTYFQIIIEERSERAEDIKKFFLTLADKPYEFRSSWESFHKNTIKIIIEENQYLDGGHIIKDKSRHFTAYIDASQSSKSIVKALIAMVQKAESTFK